jgi:hypothetical protein
MPSEKNSWLVFAREIRERQHRDGRGPVAGEFAAVRAAVTLASCAAGAAPCSTGRSETRFKTAAELSTRGTATIASVGLARKFRLARAPWLPGKRSRPSGSPRASSSIGGARNHGRPFEGDSLLCGSRHAGCHRRARRKPRLPRHDLCGSLRRRQSTDRPVLDARRLSLCASLCLRSRVLTRTATSPAPTDGTIRPALDAPIVHVSLPFGNTSS